jgi:endonuclease/exonuclease/phosphatase family metal-dependent hydrolase
LPRFATGVADTVRNGADARPFRPLSYNIQVGIATSRFRHYVTGGWKHLLPHRARLRTLASIADPIRGYDLVGVQETDSGSRRTDYIGQTEYLARRAGYAWWGERPGAASPTTSPSASTARATQRHSRPP